MINCLAYFNVEVMALILVGVLVMFGGKKIPELMRGIGQGVGELKKGMEDGQRHLMNSIHDSSHPAPAPTSETVVPLAAPVEPKVTSS